MRKIIVTACMAAVVLMLAGCGDSEKEIGQGTDGTAQGVEGIEQGTEDIAQRNENADEQDDQDTADSPGGQADAQAKDTEAGDTQAGQDGADTAQEGQADTEPEAAEPVSGSISFLGDSITTFRGYNPEGYAVFFPEYGDIKSVEDTWWHQVVNDLGLTLYQNGSSSGATVAGDSTGTEDPACACNELRTSALTGPQGACPEIILVYLGTNDLLNAVPLGTNDGTTPVEEGEITTFSDAYTLMLDKLQAKYPLAEICCCTLLQVGNHGEQTPYVDFVGIDGLTAADYSRAIVRIAENRGIFVIDLQDCGITIDNLIEMTTDGVHPTKAGMACIAEAVKKALRAR